MTLYIENNPAERHEDLDVLINDALKKSKIMIVTLQTNDSKIQNYIKTRH